MGNIISGNLSALWEYGYIETQGILDLSSGKTDAHFINTDELGKLLELNFINGKTGEPYGICFQCHKYKVDENDKCVNPDCSGVQQLNLF